MTNYVRRIREQKQLTREVLAKRVGTSTSQITKLERGERKLSQEWMDRLASALGVHPVALMSVWSTEVVGQVRDDGEIVYREKGGTPSVVEIETPAGSPDTIKAVEVQGDDLVGFAEASSVLFFDWNYPNYHPGNNLGRMCVVWRRDKRVFIRRVLPGTRPDRWTLVTASGRAEYDIDVVQANPITWIRMPEPQSGDI